MADPWVEAVQQWLNNTYTGVNGWSPVTVTGRTGWPTMRALTRALQHELGIVALSDNFGPGTIGALSALGEIGPSSTHPNIHNILNVLIGGLYCKGYNAGDGNLPGAWHSKTTSAVVSIQANTGTPQTGTVSPKLFQAILNMDAYTLVGSGTSTVREVQQWMNGQYHDESWFSIIPADGSYSRNVQRALVYAIQVELGVAGANGNYGPGTRAAVASAPIVEVGSTDAPPAKWVRLFQAALRFNTFETSFTGSFTTGDAAIVGEFQTFSLLPMTGTSDYATWSSLLVSNGDPGRKGQAADCITEVTPARASALVSDGRLVIGRYLTNAGGPTSLNKRIQPGELQAIFAAGLRVFPIYQTTGSAATYFSSSQGYIDAGRALDAATGYGFLRGTTIYFAVDFDATDADITNHIIPHFEGLRRGMRRLASRYTIGIYGTRNVCERVSRAGLAQFSFVAGMSTGFSGNLGFLLPWNWAFDQISTLTVGTGSGAIEIDNNIYSGRDAGQSSVSTLPSGAALDTVWDPSLTSALKADVETYLLNIDYPIPPEVFLLNGGPAEVTDSVLAHDSLITSLSRAWGIRKALIQTVALWEHWRENTLDWAADTAVRNWYTYREVYEAWLENPIPPAPPVPVPVDDDSSTGFAQITAATAIAAHNWAVAKSYIVGAPLDASAWRTVWEVWANLNEDVTYNLATVPMVLMWGAEEVEIVGAPRLDYSVADIVQILARYNGLGQDAQDYGERLYGLYALLESYNLTVRS